ncbi:hypothetical protein [Celeribacter neptunius]|uniref:hypothetical protein n=1 Tax=Celeribacter neptunius TaxID=588602 RepID=UPI000B7D3C03|nr:hypothetical protein [Celeribacter neptunius]
MDLTSVSEIIGLATGAVGLTGKAASTAETIKGLISSDKEPDKGETAQLLNTLASQLTAANLMNVQLSEALRSLSADLQKQDEFEREKARYELHETGDEALVFKLREDAANGQPMHYLCPVCLHRDKLFSYLQGDNKIKFCQTDSTHFFHFAPREPRKPRRGSAWVV